MRQNASTVLERDGEDEDDIGASLPADRAKREEELLLLLLSLVDDTKGHLRVLAHKLVANELDIRDWADQMAEALKHGHARAAYLGRLLAGIVDAFNEGDEAFAVTIMTAQWDFIDGFLYDLNNGRYVSSSGALSETGIAARADLYGQRLVGTANEAWARAINNATTLFYWYLGETNAHCADCPSNANNSPYLFDDLPGFPGDGSTQCLVNCKCYLRTGSDAHSFILPGALQNNP